ncbi:MAG: hypothetical protein R3A13_09390 [Bdellovibrionota bacterium]
MKKLFLFVSLIFLSACAPRGESHTLEQVLKSSQDRYAAASEQAGALKVANVLNQTKQHLEDLLTDENAEQTKTIYETANLLSELSTKAGYTSRPAMTELINQYRELGQLGQAESDQLTLLVSRTYSALASELETTKFQL